MKIPLPPLVSLLPALVLALLLLVPPLASQAAQDQVYHGNVRSRIFHRQGCRYFDCAMCTAVFASKQAALSAGYRGCLVCKP